MTETPNSHEDIARSLDTKLRLADLPDSSNDIDALSKHLDKPEKILAIKAITGASIEAAIQKIRAKEWPLSPSDQKILGLYERLFAMEASLNKQLAITNKPSGKISAVLNGNGGALNFEQLKNLPPEKIQELFRSVNKGDLIAMARSIPEKKPEWVDQLTFDLLKSIVSATLATMIQNGVTIENQGDIDFLEKNGNDQIKLAIKKAKEWTWILKDYTWNPKVIIKSNGSDVSLDPLVDASEKLIKGIDISKINTVDLKVGAEQLKKQLPVWTDKAKMEEMVRGLLDSKNGALRGLGELMKIFWALLGLNFDKKAAPGEKTLELDKKWKRDFLESMSKKNDRYDIATIFDAQWNLAKDHPKLQSYLEDVAKLQIAKDIPTKNTDDQYVYDEKLTKAIKDYQISVWIKENPSGKLDAKWIWEILLRLDTDGKVKSDIPAVAPSAIAPETPKHRLTGLYEWLKNKQTFDGIRSDSVSRELIQKELGVTGEWSYWPKTKAAVVDFQIKELGMQKIRRGAPDFADGLFWPDTVRKLWEKIKKDTPNPTEAKK